MNSCSEIDHLQCPHTIQTPCTALPPIPAPPPTRQHTFFVSKLSPEFGKYCFEQIQSSFLWLYFFLGGGNTQHLVSGLLYKLSDKSGNSNLGLRKSDVTSLWVSDTGSLTAKAQEMQMYLELWNQPQKKHSDSSGDDFQHDTHLHGCIL